MGTVSKHSHRKLTFKGTSFTETSDFSKTEVKENIYSHFPFTFGQSTLTGQTHWNCQMIWVWFFLLWDQVLKGQP